MAFYWHKGSRKEEGHATPLGTCLVNLQSVKLWQVLESRLSNKLDGIVVKMAAKEMSNWSDSAAHEEKMFLQVKSPGATITQPCRRCWLPCEEPLSSR